MTNAAGLFLLRDERDVADARAATGQGVALDFPQTESHALSLLTRRSYNVIVWEPVTLDAGFVGAVSASLGGDVRAARITDPRVDARRAKTPRELC
jgi:hypothetical protein